MIQEAATATASTANRPDSGFPAINCYHAMAQYYRDCLGVVHVRDLNSSGGEYTACGYAWDNTTEDERFNGETMSMTKGPATCLNCKVVVMQMRETVKGVRFSESLVSS